ncbi:hypothetical protein U1Q18_042506 [Sarracenia purpurea var. burkii]
MPKVAAMPNATILILVVVVRWIGGFEVFTGKKKEGLRSRADRQRLCSDRRREMRDRRWWCEGAEAVETDRLAIAAAVTIDVPTGEERWFDGGAVVAGKNGGAGCRCWRVWKSPFGGDKPVATEPLLLSRSNWKLMGNKNPNRVGLGIQILGLKRKKKDWAWTLLIQQVVAKPKKFYSISDFGKMKDF